MESENFEKKKRIVVGGFIALGILLFAAIMFNKIRKENEQYEKATIQLLMGWTISEDEKMRVLTYMRSNPRSETIEEAYIKNSFNLLSNINLLDEPIQKTILFETLGIQNNFENYINRKFIHNSNPAEHLIVDRLIQREYPHSASIIKKYILENIKDNDIVENGFAFLSNANLIDKNTYQLFKEYIQTMVKYDSVKYEERSDRTRSESLKADLNVAVSEYNQIKNLKGIIISKYNDDTYSIALGGLESNALLQTNVTEFQSRGTFSIYARKEGTIPVRLKEEFGGFNQNWPLYVEVEPNEIIEKQKNLNKLVEDIGDYKKRSIPSELKIKEYNNALLALRKSLVDTLAK